MSSQYRNQFFSYFVEKTLPGTSLPHQTMSWETFDRTQRAAPEDYKQVDVYHDSILIQCKKESQKNQEMYILKSDSFSTEQETKETTQISLAPRFLFSIPSQNGFSSVDGVPLFHLLNQLASKNFYYQLDEFPLKMDTMSEMSPSDDFFDITLPVDKGDIPPFVKISSFHQSTNPNKTGIQIPSSFLSNSNSPQLNQLAGVTVPTYLPTGMISPPLSEKIDRFIEGQSFSREVETQKEYYSQIALLQNYFQELFYQNSLPPPESADLSSEKSSLNDTNQNSFIKTLELAKYSSDDILEVLSEVSPIQSTELIKPRRMSGYVYPDMDTSKVWSLGIQFYSQIRHLVAPSEIGIKINLPPSFAFNSPTVYFLPKSQNPQLKVKTYFGPEFLEEANYVGVVIGKDRKTDDIAVTNKNQIRHWAYSYFGHGNALTDRRDGFFGINYEKGTQVGDSTAGFQNTKMNQLVKETPSMRQKLVSRRTPNQSAPVPKPPCFEYFPVIIPRTEVAIPKFDEAQWEIIKDQSSKGQFNIPTIRVPQATQNEVEWPRTRLDYPFNPRVSQLFSRFKQPAKTRDPGYVTRNNLPIFIHFSPSIPALTTESITAKSRFDQTYKKVTSVYDASPQDGFTVSKYLNFFSGPFTENREPLTLNSWLFITQFSVALFIFKSIQEVYTLYGKEVVSYFLELAATFGQVDPEVREFLEDVQTEKSYRVLTKVKDRFQDFVGMEEIIDEFADIVWFLRNSGRFFQAATNLPTGILLVGPPGTGKTLLARALAGESQVPVLVESGSSMTNPNSKMSPSERVKMVFDKARELAPCILFIDEIDTLGPSRDILQSTKGELTTIGDAYHLVAQEEKGPLAESNENEFIEQLKTAQPDVEEYATEDDDPDIPKENLAVQKLIDQMQGRKRKVTFLTQLLMELDGLQSRTGVIVIGATNRPDALDSALLRPGRFDRKVFVKLPGKEKRIEILQFYGKRVGFQEPISWDYLANRTMYFSSADLAALMNESAIQAIFNNTVHTIETIEKGIDLVTSYSVDKMKLKRKFFKDPYFVGRFAYYQAGKAVLHSLLENHPPAVVLYLWPRVKNARHGRIKDRILFNSPFRADLETRLVGFYAGKAAEMVLVGSNYKNYSKVWQSDLGGDELQYASALAYSMVDKWYLYAKRISSRRAMTKLQSDRNLREIKFIERIEKLKVLFEDFMSRMDRQSYDRKEELESPQDLERWGYLPWWQREVAEQVGTLDKGYAEWYRIRVYDPKRIKWNLEIPPSDKHYHENDRARSLSTQSTVDLNQAYEIDRDYVYHSLIMNCFNRAFRLVDKHRELVDIFADYLVRNEILRQDEITKRVNQYLSKYPKIEETKQSIAEKKELRQMSVDEATLKDQRFRVIDKSWGPESRRPLSRFIDFDAISVHKEKIADIQYPEYDPFGIVPMNPFVYFPFRVFALLVNMIEQARLEEGPRDILYIVFLMRFVDPRPSIYPEPYDLNPFFELNFRLFQLLLDMIAQADLTMPPEKGELNRPKAQVLLRDILYLTVIARFSQVKISHFRKYLAIGIPMARLSEPETQSDTPEKNT